MQRVALRGETALIQGGSFKVMLATSSAALTPDTNTVADIYTELITEGNGYTHAVGFNISADSSGFDVATEDDTADSGYVQCKDVQWTASGGSIPASGTARYAILTDAFGGDAATVTQIQGRHIWYYWDLATDVSVSDTQRLTLEDSTITIVEPS